MTNPNPEIERAASVLAQAEVALQDAQQRHQAALGEVAVVQGRLDAVAARRVKVREDLGAGRLTDREAGGLLALADEDLADLHGLLVDAQGRASAAAPVPEQNALSLAMAELDRAEREAAFRVLHGRTQELEMEFMRALARLYELGQGLGRGRSLSGIYRPGEDLRRVLVYNAAPSGVHHG